MEFFKVIINSIETSFRTLGQTAWGGIIFGLLMGALVCFLFSTKSAKKDKFIKNYFLFYLSILMVIIAVVLTVLLSRFTF